MVDHRPDDVLKQAAEVDARIASGEDAGILAGVPVTVKVNIDQEGFASTNGLKLQRDAIAPANSPVVDNLKKAGAIILGRTNCPAFSYRWFTTNLIHGDTKNPRDPSITPGGSSGGAGAAVAAGIGAIAHGTDIAGSIRYPAYACGVHGLRTTLGRVPAFNPGLPERGIGAQIEAVSGPLARTIKDLRISLAAMSARDPRDPWWVPAPLDGPAMPKRAALCLNPDGLDPVPEVKAALADAGERLRRAGWTVEEIPDTPPLREPADWNRKLWLGDMYEAQLATAEKEGDPGALACLRGNRAQVTPFDQADFSRALTRRATLAREWIMFLEKYAGAADAGLRRIAVPRSSRPQGRCVFCAGLARAADADRYSLPGPAWANRLHGTGREGSGRRAGHRRAFPRGPLPCRRRGDRGRRRAAVADRSGELRENECPTIYDFTAKSLAGEDVPLQQYAGKVLLIVNTASKCGFTPQYEGLEELHRELAPTRLRRARLSLQPVRRAGAGRRERRSREFCETNYDVTFPMFAKIEVNGSDAHPLFNYLKRREVGPARLVDQMEFHQIPGRPQRARWSRATRRPPTPQGLKKDIEALL